LKIALVHKRLDLKGGTERDLYQTAKGLGDLGHEVHLFCSEYAIEPPEGVIAHRVSVLPFGRTARLWSFAWFVQKEIAKAACDVVIGFGRVIRQDILRCGGGTHRGFLRRLGQEAAFARRLWQQVSLYHRSLLAMERRQYDPSNSKLIIAVSEQVKRDIVANYGVPDEKIVVLYNGVDTRRFDPVNRTDTRNRMRRRWSIPVEAPVVLFVGSGFRRKGLDQLLSLWKSPDLERVFLLVLGSDARLGSYRARADAVAPGRIIFAGRQEDIENYYLAADAVALPSIQEAFGNVVLEALACGLPVLVSREAGAADLLHGRLSEGVVDRPSDLGSLRQTLLHVLEQAKHPQCSFEARSIAERYSWENHFKNLADLLLKVRKVDAGSC
jgi:UDP-glucose:(heptosyl)LPS alpha-1,3-glucosyltransferase